MPTRKIALRRRKTADSAKVVAHEFDQAWRQQESWLKKNRAALDAYNEHVEEHGVFSNSLRSF